MAYTSTHRDDLDAFSILYTFPSFEPIRVGNDVCQLAPVKLDLLGSIGVKDGRELCATLWGD
jgi:hypothetical protein